MDSLQWTAQPAVIFDGGVRIELPTLKEWDAFSYWWEGLYLLQARPCCIAILGCKPFDTSEDSLGIPLVGWGYRSLGRRDNLVLVRDAAYRPLLKGMVKPRLQRLFIKPELRPELRPGDVIFRQFDCQGLTHVGQDYQSLWTEYNASERLLRSRVEPHGTRLFSAYWAISGPGDTRGFAVIFGKSGAEELPFADRPLYVAFASGEPQTSEARHDRTSIEARRDRNPLRSLYGKLTARHTLQAPSDSATWTCRQHDDVFKVTVRYEKRYFVQRGVVIWVDVIDILARPASTREPAGAGVMSV